jgi:hypothetical protein
MRSSGMFQEGAMDPDTKMQLVKIRIDDYQGEAQQWSMCRELRASLHRSVPLVKGIAHPRCRLRRLMSLLRIGVGRVNHS